MASTDAAMASRIREAAADVIAAYHVPGISIGVVQGDELVFCEGFGHADVESTEPMGPERRQRIASITKTMVGLCAMALFDEGKLALDRRVVELLPEVTFHGPAETMTLRHLLTHTSGIGEAPTRERLADAANPDRAAVSTPGDFSTLYPSGIVVEVEPGSKWAYCNNGYGLLGEIIVRAEGASLQDVMQRRIWGPLAMASTDILDQNDERITTCYHRPPNEDNRFQLERAGVVVKDEPTVDGHNIRGKFTADFNQGMRAAGGVQSTVPDMAKYASALLRRGTGIVRAETFDAMTSAHCGDDRRMTSWGLSIARTPLRVTSERPLSWKTMLGHGGAYFGGWNSHLDVLPEANIGIVQHLNIMMDEPAPVFRADHPGGAGHRGCAVRDAGDRSGTSGDGARDVRASDAGAADELPAADAHRASKCGTRRRRAGADVAVGEVEDRRAADAVRPGRPRVLRDPAPGLGRGVCGLRPDGGRAGDGAAAGRPGAHAAPCRQLTEHRSIPLLMPRLTPFGTRQAVSWLVWRLCDRPYNEH